MVVLKIFGRNSFNKQTLEEPYTSPSFKTKYNNSQPWMSTNLRSLRSYKRCVYYTLLSDSCNIFNREAFDDLKRKNLGPPNYCIFPCKSIKMSYHKMTEIYRSEPIHRLILKSEFREKNLSNLRSDKKYTQKSVNTFHVMTNSC